ncbi:hypothetical protein DM02DRAFT_668028 [Periconia macrospinosa]|uniref:Uncharacterized protein n=1 Tax=Periconia macrospinosa TaxID=97972 RepID=A0A2V1E8M2_9PLEO|nr:hypothetical protein DM02DRAFT_668028 [Periconia macrospinosa]
MPKGILKKAVMSDSAELSFVEYDNSKTLKAWRKSLPKKSEKALVDEFKHFFITLDDEFECEDIKCPLPQVEASEPSPRQDRYTASESSQRANTLLAIQQEYQGSLTDSTVGMFSDMEVVTYEMLFDAEGNFDDDFVPTDLDEKYRIAEKFKQLENGEFEEVIDPSVFFLKQTTNQLRQRVPSQQCSKSERGFPAHVSGETVSNPPTNIEEQMADSLIKHDSYDLQVGMVQIETDIPEDLLPHRSPSPPAVPEEEWGYTDLMKLCGLYIELSETSSGRSSSPQDILPSSESVSSEESSVDDATQGLSYFDIPSQTNVEYSAFNELFHKHSPRIHRDDITGDDTLLDEHGEPIDRVREFAPGYADDDDEFYEPQGADNYSSHYAYGDNMPPFSASTTLTTDDDVLHYDEHKYERQYNRIYCRPHSLESYFIRKRFPKLDSITEENEDGGSLVQGMKENDGEVSESSMEIEVKLDVSEFLNRRSDSLNEEVDTDTRPRSDPGSAGQQLTSSSGSSSPANIRDFTGRKGFIRRLKTRREDFLDDEFDDDDDGTRASAQQSLASPGVLPSPGEPTSACSADSKFSWGSLASESSLQFEKEGRKGVVKRLSQRRADFLDDEFDDDEEGG